MLVRRSVEGDDHDVLIVGAGPAGASTALALRQAGVARVAMLKTPPSRFAPRRPRMVESASPDLPALLARLGLSLPGGARPIPGQGSAWGGALRWEAFERRGLPPAWRLDRQRFDADLLDAAVAAGVVVVDGHLLACDRSAAGMWQARVAPRSGAVVTLGAPWMVDASGRRSALARQLGARRLRIDVQLGMATRVDLAGATALLPPLAEQLLVESCDLGWWYAAPDAEQRLSLCLFSDRDLLRGPVRWRSALAATEYLGELFALLPPQPRLFGHAAESACLDRAAGDGWLAVGDALMSLDPLSSSGISWALRDGIDCVAQVLIPAMSGGSPAALAQQWAQRANRHWQHYLRERSARYRLAGGRYNSPYWQRRQQLPLPIMSAGKKLVVGEAG